jgi:hypothetical protein
MSHWETDNLPRQLTPEESAAYIALVLEAAKKPRPPREPWTGPTIHYTELGPSNPESPLALEWDTFRQELGRLIQDGHEGKHVLIKGNQIIGIWDSYEGALEEGYRRFPFQPIAVQLIAERQPLYRIGYTRLCRD